MLPWLIGGGLIAGTILAADHLTGKKWASPDELDVHGPRFPVEQKLGRFQVQGYAAGGWPLAVDVYTEPGTRTWLDVRYKGQDEPEAIDLTRPDGGRRIEFIQLPGIPGVVKVARYSLHSALIRPGQEPLYRPMKIYGIGAGPNAAGAIDARQSSLRIEGVHARFGGAFALRSGSAPIWLASAPADFGTDLGAFAFAAAGADPQPPRVGSYLSVTAFGPQYPSRPADVSWAVAARQPFQRSELEVLQLPRDGDGKFIAVVRADLDLFAKPQAFGSWGGTPGLMNVGAGTYLLQARAWRTRAGGGDWTGAFGPDYVYIR